jgi:hypothetical protein
MRAKPPTIRFSLIGRRSRYPPRSGPGLARWRPNRYHEDMLPRLSAALVFACLPLVASAATGIVRVWTSYRTVDSFKRVSEFFDGQEDTGSEAVHRSQAGARDGFYFLVRTKTDTAQTGASIAVDIVLPGRPEVKRFSFPVDLPPNQKVFQLGLTGADWPGVTVRPSAWRITLVGADGSKLATQQIFLWSDPINP